MTVDRTVDDSARNDRPDAQAVVPVPAVDPQASDHSNGTANAATRKRGGAPSGNTNAATHGLKGSTFPPGAIREQTTVRAIVRAAQAACEAKHGHPVTVHQMSVLHRLRRAATKDRLAARWLRLESNKLTVEQRLALTDAMEASSATIEKCLRQLGLDAQAAAADPWAALDSQSLGRPAAASDWPTAAETPSQVPEKRHKANGAT